MKLSALYIALSLLFILSANAQDLKKQQLKKLNTFGITVESPNLEQVDYMKDIKEILKKERKRKKNKTLGYVFATVGVLSAASGIVILSARQDNGISSAIGGIFGGSLLGLGVLEMGTSIPLFTGAKKRKKERNTLIKQYNPDFVE